MLSRRTTPRRREGRRNSRSVEEGVLEVWSLERIKCGGSVWTNNDTINNQHDFASKVLRSPTGACYGMIGYFFVFLTFPSKLTVVFGKHCSSKRSPLISDKQWGQNCPLIMLLPQQLANLAEDFCKDYMQEFFLGGCSGDDYAAFIKFNTGSQDKCSVSIKICPFNSYNSISNQLFQLHFFYLIIHSRPTAALKKAVSFTALRKIRLKELTATSSSLNPSNYYFLSIPSISQTIFFFTSVSRFVHMWTTATWEGGLKER